MTAFRLLLLLVLIGGSGSAGADWVADPANKKQVASANAIEQVKERIPRSQPFFEDAYAMAVFPSVTRFGFGFGVLEIFCTDAGLVELDASAGGQRGFERSLSLEHPFSFRGDRDDEGGRVVLFDRVWTGDGLDAESL